MKSYVFILFIFFITIFSYAQEKPGFLQTKAFHFRFEDINYDSALHYYKRINKEFPDYNTSYIFFNTGRCYKQVENLSKAEEYFLKCLSIHKKTNAFAGEIQQSACFELYEIYYKTRQYKKALSYLDSTKTKYKPLIRTCQGGFGFSINMSFNYKRALCYDALCQSDSVVSILAPWLFKPAPYDWLLDSSMYANASKLFVKCAVSIYGETGVKELMTQAIKNCWYNVRYEKTNGPYLMAFVECGFEFLGATVHLNIGGIGVEKEGELYDFLKKEYLISQALQSYTYKLISQEKNFQNTFAL